MAKSLLGAGLRQKLSASLPVLQVPSFNNFYSGVRDRDTHCLNAGALVEYSKILGMTVCDVVARQQFAFVLGGDSSILVGILSGVRQHGKYGLAFIDGHSNFYQPEKSPTGELADMTLAIVSGHGPKNLVDMNGMCPYVADENIIHIGQREQADLGIKETAIKRYDLGYIREQGLGTVAERIALQTRNMDVDGIWIHLDTDVLDDRINPAVQYRLPGGMLYHELETIIGALLSTGLIAGISVTTFNPLMDTKGTIAAEMTNSLSRAFTTSIHHSSALAEAV